jgi:hypothetical protein
MRERITISTDKGVRAYAAGTQVTKTGEDPGGFMVTDGKDSFVVPQSKLTRDLAEVDQIRRSMAAGQTPASNTAASTSKPPAAKGPSPDSIRRRAELDGMMADVNRQLLQYGKALRTAQFQKAQARTPDQIHNAGATVAELERTVQSLEQRRMSLASQLSILPR